MRFEYEAMTNALILAQQDLRRANADRYVDIAKRLDAAWDNSLGCCGDIGGACVLGKFCEIFFPAGQYTTEDGPYSAWANSHLGIRDERKDTRVLAFLFAAAMAETGDL